jgi:hypothetical protein
MAHAVITWKKSRDPGWFKMLNLISSTIVAFLFVGYWVESFVVRITPVGILLFCFSVVWEARTIGHGAEENLQDVSPEARLLAKRFCQGFDAITAFIGLWYGGIAVFRTL